MSKPPMVFDPAQHTGAGRSKRRPPPRPAGDSLPRFDCGVTGCGTDHLYGPGTLHLHRWTAEGDDAVNLHFCSFGCLGRWAALQEVRQ